MEIEIRSTSWKMDGALPAMALLLWKGGAGRRKGGGDSGCPVVRQVAKRDEMLSGPGSVCLAWLLLCSLSSAHTAASLRKG